jgi:hypothetical protein
VAKLVWQDAGWKIRKYEKKQAAMEPPLSQADVQSLCEPMQFGRGRHGTSASLACSRQIDMM